ncbi:MAG TPA: hypothetical protein VEI49_08550 [Terriglobales bacterium]|nr:hypothetical protein [Terriglobales bacterium]
MTALRFAVLFLSWMVTLALGELPAAAQVSPDEVTNPELKELTSLYFQKLIAMNRQVGATKFPFTFHLARYIGLDPKNQLGGDTRGLEFVQFHERTILKCSGNYNAAFSAKQYNRNQRADHVFSKVIEPMLQLLPEYFAEAKDFEGVGFEISYHIRESNGKADYEGRENLVVVLPLPEALRFPELRDDQERQALLNDSEVYVSGERFGLAIGKVDAVVVENIKKKDSAARTMEVGPSSQPQETAERSNDLNLSGASGIKNNSATAASSKHPDSFVDARPLAPADVDELQTKYQPVLDAFGKEVDSIMRQPNRSASAPDLALIRSRLYLQFTLRNPQAFSKESTSLYKRAALSFDTFLAPHLADLLAKLPAIPDLAGLSITVLVNASAAGSSSEAIEFMCPLAGLRNFTAFEITNQELIDQSIVVVNGVRISLNLQQVE